MKIMEEFQEKLKRAIDTIREDTVYEILKNDIHYQKISRREAELEETYMTMRSTLTKEQDKLIHDLLDCRDEMNVDYNAVSYLAGTRDMIRIFTYLNI